MDGEFFKMPMQVSLFALYVESEQAKLYKQLVMWVVADMF